MQKRRKTKVTDIINFWNKLPRPFFVLAPMANVTDYAFRVMIAKYGKPDVMWTEFVSADGLISAGRDNLLVDLKFSNKERPIVAQLFTGHPEAMRKAAKLVAKLGFDGLDINMGCPDRKVEKQGGGAAVMRDPQLAVELIRVAREEVESRKLISSAKASKIKKNLEKKRFEKNDIPISVKTRIGYNKVDWDWIRLLLGQKLPALTIHLRTRKEMSDVPAHWELMPEIIRLRDEISPETLIIGNGDVESIGDARLKCKQYGCDGAMIGRGVFGKPWLFNKCPSFAEASEGKQSSKSKYQIKSKGQITPEERLKILLEHTKLFQKVFLPKGKKRMKNFAVMKKHFKAYVSGWEGAKELRVELMETDSAEEVKNVVRKYLKSQKWV